MNISDAVEQISSLIETVDDWGYEALREAASNPDDVARVKRAKQFGSAKRSLEQAREQLRRADEYQPANDEN